MTSPDLRPIAPSVHLLLLLTLGLTGCGGGGEFAWVLSLGGSITFGGLKWAILCGFLGLVVAGPIYWILKRSGALHAEWKVAKLFQLMTLIGLLVIFPIAFAYGGFFEGVLRATEHELTQGMVARDIYPPIGGVGADFVGVALLAAQSATMDTDQPVDDKALLVAFQNGEQNIVANTIPETLARIEGEYLQEFAEQAKKEAQEKLSILREDTGAQILYWFVDNCREALARSTMEKGLDHEGGGAVVRLFRDFVHRLPEAALLDNDPETVSHSELSRFIVEATLAKGVIRVVVRPFCRGHQIGALMILVAAVLLPICLLRFPPLVMRWLEKRGKAHPEVPPPAT